MKSFITCQGAKVLRSRKTARETEWEETQRTDPISKTYYGKLRTYLFDFEFLVSTQPPGTCWC